MRSQFIIIILMIATTFACNKSNHFCENDYVILSYELTSCSDPWVNTVSDSLTLVNVSNYLRSAGLHVASISLKSAGNPIICSACICKTGKTIMVSTINNEAMKNKYLLIGFK